MGIQIFPDSSVYIACPANVATGGPELLHQLAFHLRNEMGIKAYVLYYNFTGGSQSPVHPAFRIYNVPFVLEIPSSEDQEKNILIVPEISSALKLLRKYKNIRKGVWFLSVDNYYLSKLKKTDFIFKRLLIKLLRSITGSPFFVFDVTSKELLNKLMNLYNYQEDRDLINSNFYLFQSYYSLVHFGKLKPSFYLSDYLNKDFLTITTDFSKKENFVVFNPKKGFSYTKEIIKAAKDITFVPIVNMTREQVIEILQRAKVYIDFGNHPGKDRIPREAAILGCCVITSKRGSAAFQEDVPIPERYKFDDTLDNVPRVVETIRYCFENFDEAVRDFDFYRELIKEEPKKFIDDLKKIFVKIDYEDQKKCESV